MSAASADPALLVEGLTKRYGGSGNGVRDLRLSVPRGGIHGFLGRNGAGKTTTMKCIMGLLRRDAGRFALFGEPYDPLRNFQLRRRIGYSPELPTFPAHLTGREVLEQYGRMRGLGKVELRQEATFLLRQLELTDAADQKARTYSKGMQSKLGIAVAMLGDPEMLILDEPTSGLDPVAMAELRKLLRGLASPGNGGRTVLLSSHQLFEVQQLCSSVTIIDQGATRAEGSLDQLMQRVMGGTTYRAEFQSLGEPLIAAIRSLPEVSRVEPIPGVAKTLRIWPKSNVDLREVLARLAVNRGTLLLSCERETLSVEDLFLSFVQQAPPQGDQPSAPPDQYQPSPPVQPVVPQAPINPPAESYQPLPVNPIAPEGPQPSPGTGAHVPGRFCLKCSAPLPLGFAFCGACGARIG